ncbi:MAG: DUF4339 domain-containing protein [Chlamydiia bacterium]|nr:DUF4339 domain-containing protein [Chlamydiia bacterium]
MFLRIVVVLLAGALTSYFARIRGRDPFIWFTVGILLGVFGVLIVLLLPSVKEEEEEAAPEPPPQVEVPKETRLWFYLNAQNEQQGPVTEEELKNLIDKEILSSESLLWSEGMEEWQPLKMTDLLGRKS